MRDDVSIVTAFMDIGRDTWTGEKNGHAIPPYIKRDVNTYFERFERLAKLNNNIVVFTDSKFFPRIQEIREDITLVGIDTLFTDHSFLVHKIKSIQESKEFVQFVQQPASPEYWSPEYVIINLMKSHFVNFAVESNMINTTNAAWVDFGYCRENVVCPEGMTWCFDTQDKINLFCQNPFTHTKPIFEIIRTGEVYIQGCHIVAPCGLWKTLKQLINDNLSTLFSCGLVDDDQTLLLMAYRSAPELFNLLKADPVNWFTIFENRCQ